MSVVRGTGVPPAVAGLARQLRSRWSPGYHGSAAAWIGRGRHVGFVLHLALKNFLGYGRAFLPARGLIVRNAHIGKPRVSRGVFWPPVAFGMFITIHRALNLLTRPDEIPALGAGAGGWIEPTRVSRRSAHTRDLLCLRCYKNWTVRKAGTLDVPILVVVGGTVF